MMFFKLDCGRSVAVDSFEFERTYAGQIDGQPNERTNEMILREVIGKQTKGKYVLLPPVDRSDPSHPRLPPVILRVRLLSFSPIDSQFMASGLWLAFFANDEEIESLPIGQVIERYAHRVDWNAHAQDFDW